MKKLPKKSLLRELLDYNPDTGIFVWKKNPRLGRARKGMVAGTIHNGYIYIGISGYGQMPAHRLAWIYVHGVQIGGFEIDHIDGNPANNAIANLRIATSSQQKRNKSVQSNNRSGLKGAYYHACHKGKKWRSQIKIRVAGEPCLVFLGYFHTAEEAHAAYGVAAREFFGEFARAA